MALETPALETALISAGVSLLMMGGAFALNYFTRRDEKRIKLAVEQQLTAGRISLEGQVRVLVDTQLKVHDARLRVAVEWRVKMLEKMLEAGGTLRMRLNAIFAAINKLSREATVHGRGGKTQALIHECDDAIREVTTSGGFLTPSLTERARDFIARFDAIVAGIVKWANETTEQDRHMGCQASDRDLEALGIAITEAFGVWHRQMWDWQEQALFARDTSELPGPVLPPPP